VRLPDPQKSHAVLIGTSAYESAELTDLPAVRNNLDDLFAVLTDPSLGGIPPERCVLIHDPSEVRPLYTNLRTYARAAEDTLLVYFAGHGLTGDHNELYLGLADTDLDELSVSAFPFNEVRKAFAVSPAANRIVILDCCFSGRAIQDMSNVDGTILGQIGIEGTYVLTSAPANAVALAPTGATHTAFTGELINLLQAGVRGGPELLTFNMIYRQLLSTTRTRRLPEPRQRGTGTVDLLALARNRAFVPPAPDAPSIGAPAPTHDVAGRDAPVTPPAVSAPARAGIGELAEALDILEAAVRQRCDERLRAIDERHSLPVRWKSQTAPKGLTAHVPAAAAAPRGIGKIAKLYTRPAATGRLVVLGAPGSGKSTLVDRLTIDLLDRASSGDPIPVPMMTSTWDPRTQDLRDWVVNQLAHDIPVLGKKLGRPRRSLAMALYDAGKIIPVLDGLDEIPQTLRGQALTELNRRRTSVALVLTCRTDEYRHAEVGSGLRDADIVELQPLGHGDVEKYLRRTTLAAWDNVFAQVRAAPNGPVAQALRTPLMTWLAQLVYRASSDLTKQPRNPDEMLNLPDQAAVENHLLKAMIPAVYADGPVDASNMWPAGSARLWLNFLRGHVHRAPGPSGHTIAWWELNLSTSRWLFGLVVGLLAFPIMTGFATGDMPSRIWVGIVTGAIFGAIAARRNNLTQPNPWRMGRSDIAIGVSVLGVGAAGSILLRSRDHWTLDIAASTVAVVAVVAVFYVRQLLRTNLGWGFFQRIDDRFAKAISAESPQSLLHQDRTWAMGICMFAVCWWALATLVNVLVFAGSWWQAPTALDAAKGAVGALLIAVPWVRFCLARACFALTQKMPWRIMAFLDDAHRRGILRRVGPVYEFRYYHPPEPENVPTPNFYRPVHLPQDSHQRHLGK
jgi:GTPase SAR1 family protein